MSLVSGPPFGYEYPPSIDGTRRQFYNGNRIPNLFDIKRQIFERENANFRSLGFYRKTSKRLLNLFSDAQIVGDDDKVFSVPVWYGNSERAVAKIFDDRNLIIPAITLSISDIDQDAERRRPNTNIELWTVKDSKTRRYTRVASLAPQAVNVSFQLNLWTKYVEDMNQLFEYVMNKFHPHLRVETDFNTDARGFITEVSDNSTVVAEDKQDRVIRKTITFSVETYLPSRKYMIQSNGEIQETNISFTVDANTDVSAIETSVINPSDYNKDQEPMPRTLNISAIEDEKVVLSDGYTMFYDLYLPVSAIDESDTGTVPLAILHPSTRSWRKSPAPSPAYVGNRAAPDPTNTADLLLENGYAVMSFDVRGQNTNWSPNAAGGRDASYFQRDNYQYRDASAGFAATNFCVRELLDIFEIKDHVVASRSEIEDSVGIVGGSLGGVGTTNAAAWSGKTVPYNAIVSSQDAFQQEAGASAYPSLPSDWGYTAETKFSTIKAASVGSVFGDAAEITKSSTDGHPRSPYLSGPLRAYTFNTYAPKEYELIDAAIRGDDILSYTNAVALRNPVGNELITTTVPTLVQLSFDDRQRGIDVALSAFNAMSNTRHMFVSTGHHDAPYNVNALERRTTNTVNWFNEHVKGDSGSFDNTNQFKFMITPADVPTYRDPNNLRDYVDFNTSKPETIVHQPYTLTASGANYIAIPKDPNGAEMQAGSNGTLNIAHNVIPQAPASTSQFADLLIARREITQDYPATDIVGTAFPIDQTTFFGTDTFSEDKLMVGPPSGFFGALADASGQFGYEILDYNPAVPIGAYNPRTVTQGSFTWHQDGFGLSSVSSVGRFQCYKFEAGHVLGVKIKNHTYYPAPIADPSLMTFETVPFWTNCNTGFSFANGRCSVYVPLMTYSESLLE